MTWYNNFNVKWSNSQLNKLKSEIKNASEVNLNFSSYVIGDSDDETSSPYKLLLTDRQVSMYRIKLFDNFLISTF